MINFIVCEDNKIILQKNIDIINKTMFKNNINYRIYQFTDYTSNLDEIIKSDMDNKVYLLDIELNNSSGIDIARDIRQKDTESIIILATTYVEYLPHTLKNKLMLFDYLSKFEDYEKNLSKSILRAATIYKNKVLS